MFSLPTFSQLHFSCVILVMDLNPSNPGYSDAKVCFKAPTGNDNVTVIS